MARVPKTLQPLDHEVQRILAEAVKSRGLGLRAVGELAGMSANRAGIILRCEAPPATLGELQAIARQVDMTAARLVALGEEAVRSAEEQPDARPDDARPAPHATTVTAEDIAAGVGLPRSGPRQRRTRPSTDTAARKHT